MKYGQRSVPLKKLKELLDEGKTQRQAAEELGFAEETISRSVKKLNKLAPLYELTEKEQMFVKEMATAPSQAEAAFKAFDCSSRESAKVIGSQLMARPEVKAAFAAWLEFKGMGREKRAEKLVKFIEDPDPSVSLRALEIGMKAGRDFPDPKLEIEEKPRIQYVVSFQPIVPGAEIDPNDPSIISITPAKGRNLLGPPDDGDYGDNE